jgi:hypothetical protein
MNRRLALSKAKPNKWKANTRLYWTARIGGGSVGVCADDEGTEIGKMLGFALLSANLRATDPSALHNLYSSSSFLFSLVMLGVLHDPVASHVLSEMRCSIFSSTRSCG